VAHPVERRKLAISEIKRVCSFPDDFVLLGGRANKARVLGMCVPPLMMRAIAETLRDCVLRPIAIELGASAVS
jgi:DNA (cytosine-5)-methyltransferase 1